MRDKYPSQSVSNITQICASHTNAVFVRKLKFYNNLRSIYSLSDLPSVFYAYTRFSDGEICRFWLFYVVLHENNITVFRTDTLYTVTIQGVKLVLCQK